MVYDVSETTLSAGDMLLIYSDGVPDAENEQHDFFTHERLVDLLSPLPETAELLLSRITNHLADHIGQMKQFDDITMLALTYLNQ